MLFRNSMRFKGYWLALFSWIVLTFAAPVSSALGRADAGWMRLCSAHGVQWVNISVDDDTTASSHDCVCGSLGVQQHISQAHKALGIHPVDEFEKTVPAPYRLTYNASRPRSPPQVLV